MANNETVTGSPEGTMSEEGRKKWAQESITQNHFRLEGVDKRLKALESQMRRLNRIVKERTIFEARPPTWDTIMKHEEQINKLSETFKKFRVDVVRAWGAQQRALKREQTVNEGLEGLCEVVETNTLSIDKLRKEIDKRSAGFEKSIAELAKVLGLEMRVYPDGSDKMISTSLENVTNFKKRLVDIEVVQARLGKYFEGLDEQLNKHFKKHRESVNGDIKSHKAIAFQIENLLQAHRKLHKRLDKLEEGYKHDDKWVFEDTKFKLDKLHKRLVDIEHKANWLQKFDVSSINNTLSEFNKRLHLLEKTTGVKALHQELWGKMQFVIELNQHFDYLKKQTEKLHKRLVDVEGVVLRDGLAEKVETMEQHVQSIVALNSVVPKLRDRVTKLENVAWGVKVTDECGNDCLNKPTIMSVGESKGLMSREPMKSIAKSMSKLTDKPIILEDKSRLQPEAIVRNIQKAVKEAKLERTEPDEIKMSPSTKRKLWKHLGRLQRYNTPDLTEKAFKYFEGIPVVVDDKSPEDVVYVLDTKTMHHHEVSMSDTRQLVDNVLKVWAERHHWGEHGTAWVSVHAEPLINAVEIAKRIKAAEEQNKVFGYDVGSPDGDCIVSGHKEGDKIVVDKVEHFPAEKQAKGGVE